MCLWFPVLVIGLFLLLLTFHKAQASKVPKFMKVLALVFLGRASKTFQVGGISTLTASIFLLVCTPGVKELLVVACLHSCFVWALAWPGASASCICHVAAQCTGVS